MIAAIVAISLVIGTIIVGGALLRAADREPDCHDEDCEI